MGTALRIRRTEHWPTESGKLKTVAEMESKELLLQSLTKNLAGTLSLIEDMRDVPLTFPTVHGGNHPLWILGHLAYSVQEVVQEIMLGQDNSLSEWKEIFGYGSEPCGDVDAYPEFDVMLAKCREVHGELITWLASMDEHELDTACAGCPPEYAEEFGTYRQCILALANHPLIHRGQVADARRTARRAPVTG